MRVLGDKKLLHTAFGSTEEVQLWIQEYPNGRVGLQLMAQMMDAPEEGMLEPYMTCSVNMVNASCPDNEVWVKDWAENEGITEFLKEWGVIEGEPTLGDVSGYVLVYRYRFTPAFLIELARVKLEGLKKRQGGSTTASNLVQVCALCTLIVLAGFGLDYLERITKRIEMATCTTDTECVHACRALLKADEKDDCDDFMEERE